jgi:hypothetical protein
MYKPSTYLEVAYFPCLSPYIWDLFPTELDTKGKPNITSVEVHPQLSNNGHQVDGALVGAGSVWLIWHTHTYVYNWYQFLNYIPVQHMYRPDVVEVSYKEPFDPGYFKNL